MLNVTQRIDLMKLAVDLAKTEDQNTIDAERPLHDRATRIYAALKVTVESGSVLDDTDMTEVKSAVDVVAEIDELID